MQVYDLYKFWDQEVRPITLAALRGLTHEHLHWKPEGWHSSAWDLTAHMCAVEWGWIYRITLRREPWEARWGSKRFEGLEDLLPYWEQIHKCSIEWLKANAISDLNKIYPLPYDGFHEASLHWIANHVVEHEIHHRGQLFMLLRMQGIEPPQI